MKPILCILLILLSSEALPWGKTGHRVIGEFATEMLSEDARKIIKTILGNETLADASTWADWIRSSSKSEHKKLAPRHYATIPLGKEYKKLLVVKDGDVYQSIIKIESQLKNYKNLSTEKLKLLLRLYIHFVGDIHQPLHVGNGLDKGGNLCIVKWFDQLTNLHVVWDTLFINFSEYSYTEYAKFLSRNVVKSEADKWKKDDSLTWLNESKVIRSNVYPSGKNRKYCKRKFSDHIKDVDIPKMNYNYVYKHTKKLNQRLTQAGIRLASRLNLIFSASK